MNNHQTQSYDDFFNISQLNQSSLRKYQSYFKIQCKNQQELKAKIKHHFENQFKVDANVVMQKFLKIKRDQRQTRKSTRSKVTKPAP